MKIIATDLDRTLFPNGDQEYDGSMDTFSGMIEEKDLSLIFVTGRNLEQVLRGMEKYQPPKPDYLIGEVGTKVYTVVGGSFEEDTSYIRFIEENTQNWDRLDIIARLQSLKQLSLQEEHNQNRFKISFYLEGINESEDVINKAEELIELETPDAQIIYSVDETKGMGLVDVLPKKANKLEALEFVRKKIGADPEDIIYAGDSGNDLIPLTAGYKAILVKNAIDEVREQVTEKAKEKGIIERIYFAKGNEEYNGNYVSGIIEGLKYFGVAE